ncbi:MAG: DDE-type integrase/transposase/recombinase [Rhodobacteraceae bacterium]|nr:DDE-type integrase/transposase/recombinase [Paracoccaceae bacterium]
MLDIVASSELPTFAFGKHDEILISGRSYRYFETREDAHFFYRADGTGVMQKLTNTEISRWLKAGNFQCNPDAFAPEAAFGGRELPPDLLSSLSREQQERAASREAIVMAFLEFYDNERKKRDPKQYTRVKRTDASIRATLPAIRLRAGEILAEKTSGGRGSMTAMTPVPETGSPRSIRRWVKAYEAFGLAGLYDYVHQGGNRNRRLTLDELMLLHREVQKYHSEANLTQQNIFENVKNAFEEANVGRREEGKPDLVTPSRETVRQAILALDPFAEKVSRDGRDAARAELSPVGRGIEVYRPMQRIEIDEWTVNVATLMAETGMLHWMTDEEKARFGLNRQKDRWKITTAICVRTRCIVGMVISRNPNAKSALRVIEMTMRDKGVFSDAVDALSPWNQYGWPNIIVTDCAKYNVSHDVRVRTKDAGVTILHTPAANPRMKPYIERAFRTLAINLMPRLTGYTFSNLVEKGDRDPQDRAALTAEDFCTVLVRYVVDVYHRSQHDGLNKETPLNCWNRLVKKFGVQAPPDLRRRRLVFGEALTRVVSKKGITVLGVRYQSEALARWMVHARDRAVNLRWYNEDIGAIEVEIDGKWITIPAVFDGFSGVSAQKWLCAARLIRAAHAEAAEVDRDIVRRALREIDAVNGEAMRRMGLLVEDWSAERIAEEEDRLFIGFNVSDSEHPPADAPASDSWGLDLATAADSWSASQTVSESDSVPVGETPVTPIPEDPEKDISAEEALKQSFACTGRPTPFGQAEPPSTSWTIEEK